MTLHRPGCCLLGTEIIFDIEVCTYNFPQLCSHSSISIVCESWIVRPPPPTLSLNHLFINRIVLLDERKWSTGEAEHFVGQAEFDFQGQGEDELSFTKGQKVTIAPKGNKAEMNCSVIVGLF